MREDWWTVKVGGVPRKVRGGQVSLCGVCRPWQAANADIVGRIGNCGV